jgi:type II secretion system protein G
MQTRYPSCATPRRGHGLYRRASPAQENFARLTDNIPVRRRRGFTLEELLIVIIIIASLAAIVVPKFTNTGIRSKEAALKSDLKIYRDAIGRFRDDTGCYPITLQDLAESLPPASGLDTNGNSARFVGAFRGPYIDAVVVDPVSGKEFDYSTTKPSVGRITSSASGKSTNGSAYSTW